MQTEFDQGLMEAKFMRVPVILGWTKELTKKGVKCQCYTPTQVDINLGSYKISVHLCDEIPHELHKGQRQTHIKL